MTYHDLLRVPELYFLLLRCAAFELLSEDTRADFATRRFCERRIVGCQRHLVYISAETFPESKQTALSSAIDAAVKHLKETEDKEALLQRIHTGGDLA